MPRSHALNLPEILSLISNYLTPQDLFSCIQVSQSFHLAFAPSLWANLLIRKPKPPKICFRYPSQQALTRYKHLIRRLDLDNVFPHLYLTAFQDTLQELRFATLYNRRYDSGIYKGTQQLLIGTIRMNVNSLNHLSISTTIPDESEKKNRDMWEAIASCRQATSIEIRHLRVSLQVLDCFRAICCGGDLGGNCSSKLSSSATSTVRRTVVLEACSFDEWPDALYADESFTLPFVTSLSLIKNGYSDTLGMSIYGQARMVRKCINLNNLTWMKGNSLADVARARRWCVESRNDDSWFFGGLLGDAPKGPGKPWNTVHRIQDEQDDGIAEVVWPLPHLGSIVTSWRNISDLTSSRLLKRLHRLESFQLRTNTLGSLTIEELFRERVPFRSMTATPCYPSSSFLHSSLPPLPPPMPRRLCLTVKHLDFTGCAHVTSDHTHQVLESCPVLEDLYAGNVDVSGILQRPAWVCRRIKILSLGFIFFDSSPAVALPAASADTATEVSSVTTTTTTSSTTTFDPSPPAASTATATIQELEWALFTRLAQFNCMKSFLQTTWGVPREAHLLQIKLGHGLELLTSWEETLVKLRLSNERPLNMTMDDIQWILDHWPNLKCMIGHLFNSDAAINKQILDALYSRGISLSSTFIP